MNHAKKRIIPAKRLLIIGMAGLVIELILNGFAYVVLHQPAAMPGHTTWWSTWFPVHVVWFSFLIISLGVSLRKA